MKRNHIMRTSAIVLALVLATACLVSGTFAKYTTSMAGTDSARVAYFEFGSDTLGTAQEASLNLWDTNYDANVYTSELATKASNIDDNGTKLIAPGTYGSIDLQLWGKAEVDTWLDIDYTLTTNAAIPLVFHVSGANTASTCYYSDYYAPGTTVKLATPRLASRYDNTYVENDLFFTAVIQGPISEMGDHTSRFVGAGVALEDVNPGAELINWYWAYEEQADDGTVAAGDVRDTTLGNDAVEVTEDNGVRTYTVNELTATFDVKVNVTQID